MDQITTRGNIINNAFMIKESRADRGLLFITHHPH